MTRPSTPVIEVTAPARKARMMLAPALMVASGFAALGYQMIWTRQSALWLGYESAAVLAVVAAFFGGLAVGALVLGARIERSTRPARWYAACETLIGLWSLALIFLMAPVTDRLAPLIGAQPSAIWQWSVAFCSTFVLLLPATAAMGATLPAMEQITALMRRQGSSIAALYAANTFGAVLGVLTTAFWLVPEYGLTRTTACCVALNLLCAVTALALFDDAFIGAPVVPPSSSPQKAPRVLMLLAVTGLLGIGYEVLVVRVLSQVAEDTVYTFALVLAVYLVGSALGAAVYQRILTSARAALSSDLLLLLLVASCLLGTVSLWQAENLKTALLHVVGDTFATALASEAVPAIAAFLLPTFVMGALFSHLGMQARSEGVSFGRALGINTLGAAAAPLLFGVAAMTVIGPKFALLTIAAGYLALLSRQAWSMPLVWAAATATVALALWAPVLAFIEVPTGGHVVSYREGAMAAVSVVEDADGVRRLRIDNRQQEGSSASMLADARQALLPLLLHPAPRRALFLGLGTGITASSAAQDPTLQVDAVELLPEVIEASAYFTDASIGGVAGAPNPRLRIIASDARRFVRATATRYDLIVSDNFHPARSGSGSLYTVEHFRAVKARLMQGGLFCQWLPLHQLDLETLRSIVAAFVSVYPQGSAMLATNSLETPVLGLVAHSDGGRYDVNRLRARLVSAAPALQPAKFGITDDLALLGSFVAGPRALARFASGSAANTDDRPVVAYLAPRLTYAPDSLPRDRLIALLDELAVQNGIEASELVEAPPEAAWPARLAAYWAARKRFIEAGRAVQASADAERMLAQVREPLLSVLRISPDFRPAYDPLLRMAIALAPTKPAEARALLTELSQVQPVRPEAAQALQELAGLLR